MIASFKQVDAVRSSIEGSNVVCLGVTRLHFSQCNLARRFLLVQRWGHRGDFDLGFIGGGAAGLGGMQ